MRRSDSEFTAVKELLNRGLSSYEVARRTGIPRATVQHWRHLERRRRRWQPPDPAWRPQDSERYCYLLGVYLGDGHIVLAGRSAFIRVTLDARYPGIIEEVSNALNRIFAPAPTRSWQRRHGEDFDQCWNLQLSTPTLPIAFPQHGPGRKHLRPITLEAWQEEMCRAHPRALLRGLIHSDGARCINRFDVDLPSGRTRHYEYPRYFFSNLSADIRRIFCDHCELLGIRWTQSNPRNISVSHRDSVAILDGFVGPKY